MIYFRDYSERWTLAVLRCPTGRPPSWWFEGHPAAGPVALLPCLRRLACRDRSVVEARIDRHRLDGATGDARVERVLGWRRGDPLPTDEAWKELLRALS